jgi:hypothetical protein
VKQNSLLTTSPNPWTELVKQNSLLTTSPNPWTGIGETKLSSHYQPQPWTKLVKQNSPFHTSPSPWTGAPCSPEANVGRIWVFLRMLSPNWQKTFDGASPRLSQPTLASGEHGAPVQGEGPGGGPNDSLMKPAFFHPQVQQGRLQLAQDEILGNSSEGRTVSHGQKTKKPGARRPPAPVTQTELNFRSTSWRPANCWSL